MTVATITGQALAWKREDLATGIKTLIQEFERETGVRVEMLSLRRTGTRREIVAIAVVTAT